MLAEKKEIDLAEGTVKSGLKIFLRILREGNGVSV